MEQRILELVKRLFEHGYLQVQNGHIVSKNYLFYPLTNDETEEVVEYFFKKGAEHGKD